MIEACQLTKFFGDLLAIEDVSFHVPKGQIVGFLGPNGAGKSTTMRILTAFSNASRGTATVAGHDVHEHPLAVKRSIGYLPERVPLYEEMVVSGFLRYVAEVKGVTRGQQLAEVERVCERCGLSEMRHRIIGHLSKGYRQRVGLAQALVASPPVLILDEPTVGLDPKQIVDIRQMIKGLAGDHTVLLSTHILPEVAMVCERVIIINRGRIVAEDLMDQLGGAQSTEWLLEVAPEQSARALQVLRKLPVAQSVREEAPGRISVRTSALEDAGGALSQALTAANISHPLLTAQRRSLEEAFMAAVTADTEARA